MKVVTCKYCKKRVMKYGIACPSCGKRFKLPWYKSPLLYLIVISLLSFGIINYVLKYNVPKITIDKTDVYYSKRELRTLEKELLDDYLQVKTVYIRKHLELNGYVGMIDINNKYFTLVPNDDKKFYIEIVLTAGNEDAKKLLKNLKPGDQIHTKAQVTDVDITTLTLDIDQIEKIEKNEVK